MKVSVFKNTWQTIHSRAKFTMRNLSLFRILPTSVIDLVTFAFIGFLTIYFVRPLEEPDFYWHIIVGEDIINHWDFGAPTLQTWGTFDPNWVTTQSLSEVLMYLTWLQFGKSGIALLRLFLWIYMIYWFLKTIKFSFRDSSRLAKTGKWLALSLGLFISYGFIQERPASISIFFTTLVAQDLVQLLGKRKLNLKKRTFLIFLIWPLFHPGWILPYALTLLILVCKTLKNGISKIKLSFFNFSLLLTPIIPLLMPEGSRYYKSLLTISSRGRRWISEWQPLWDLPMTSVIVWLVALYLLITLLFIWRRSAVLSIDRVLTLCTISILIFATIFAIRNAIYLVVFLAALFGHLDRLNNKIENAPKVNSKYTPIPKALFFLSMIPLLFVVLSFVYCTKLSVNAGLDVYRSDLESFLLEINRDFEAPIRIINSPNYGGNIQYLLRSKGVPLIDGRVDRYSDELQQNIDDFLNKNTGWRKVYRENLSEGCAVLLSKDDEIRPKITSLGFTLQIRRGDFYWYEKAC